MTSKQEEEQPDLEQGTSAADDSADAGDNNKNKNSTDNGPTTKKESPSRSPQPHSRPPRTPVRFMAPPPPPQQQHNLTSSAPSSMTINVHERSNYTASNNANLSSSTSSHHSRPKLSYMDEMRLAKFARSHKNLAPFIRGPTTTATTTAETTPSTRPPQQQQQQQQKSLRGTQPFALYNEAFQMESLSDVYGGLDLTDSIVHPHHEHPDKQQPREEKELRSTSSDDVVDDEDELCHRLSDIMAKEGRRSILQVTTSEWKSFVDEVQELDDEMAAKAVDSPDEDGVVVGGDE